MRATRGQGHIEVSPAAAWGDGVQWPHGMLSFGRHGTGLQVAIPKETKENEIGRVVMFPTRKPAGTAKAPRNAGEAEFRESEIDLRKYEQDNEPDDYVRRMIVNVIAFAFIVLLTLAGIWLADQLALLHKHQDCALSGRKNCAELNLQIHEPLAQPR